MRIKSTLAVALALGLASGTVGATTYTWDFAGAGSFGPTAGTKNFTSTSGGQTLAVRAYSTPTFDTSSPFNIDGNWQAANLANYSGSGLGIKNNNTYDNNSAYGTTESTSPEHSVDNQGVKDVLVFELPEISGGADWDPVSFMLGWMSTDTDVQAWIGGNSIGAGYNFTNACFSGCANTLSTLGFTDISANIKNPGDPGTTTGNGGENVPLYTAMNFTGATPTGRYLIMSGQLNEADDYWKLKKISADHKPRPMPVPGSLSLLGLGLVAFGALRRRG